MDRRNRLLLTTLLMFGLPNLTIAEELPKAALHLTLLVIISLMDIRFRMTL